MRLSFCGKKDKRAKPDEKKNGLGDAWTWVAIEQDSKLVISYRIGQRSAQMAEALMLDLRERTVGKFQLTTDALHQYLGAVEKAFTWGGVDYSMLKKVFATPRSEGPKSGERKYSPGEVVAIEKLPVMGRPDSSSISTSHIERQHLTLRMQSRRYTRLTNAFSKKLEFHLYATALHFTYYNWCRPHMTLTKKHGEKTTPAMAAGISKRVLDLGDLLDLLHGE